MRSFCLAMCAAALLCLPANAQSSAIGTVETTGSATIDVTPDYYEFWFHYTVTATSFDQAAASAAAFEQSVNDAIEQSDLDLLNLEVSGIALENMHIRAKQGERASTAKRSARLRFSATSYRGEEGLLDLAKLCDSLKAMAELLKSTVEGPTPALLDTAIHEQAAISAALKSSLPLAEGATAAINAQVLVVDKARVTKLEWNASPEWRGVLPEAQRLTCTATVDVSYAFGAQY
jgi:hypothetical protein